MLPMLVSFLKKTAYAVLGNVLAMIMFVIAGHSPMGSELELQIYAGIAALLTGAVAAIKRWMDLHLASKN